MNWVDWLLIAIMLLSGFFGWRRGLIRGVLDITTWLGRPVLGLLFYRLLGDLLHRGLRWSEIWTRPAAFVIIVFASLFVVGWLANIISQRTSTETHQSTLNRLLGILPGCFEGLINTAIVALLLLTLPLPVSIGSSARHSWIANGLAVQAEGMAEMFNPVFGEAVSKALTYITIPPGSSENIELHFTMSDSIVRPDLETNMLALVNNERKIQGLEPFQEDAELKAVARQHSTDMFVRGYFSHFTLEGLSPYDRLQVANVNFLIAGENLALAPTLTLAHEGLMNSPGHRANILRPQFRRVGIGIMDGGQYGLMITQMFRN